jgi:hypothetical protein
MAVAPTREKLLFGKWSYDDVEVSIPMLMRLERFPCMLGIMTTTGTLALDEA